MPAGRNRQRHQQCQVILCQASQEASSGRKFVLKPGDVIRIGRDAKNEVHLDFDTVSKLHAEIFLGGFDTGVSGLAIRDCSSKNGVAVRKSPLEPQHAVAISSFERVGQAGTAALENGYSLLIPAKSRRGETQMSIAERLMKVHIVPAGAEALAQTGEPQKALQPVSVLRHRQLGSKEGTVGASAEISDTIEGRDILEDQPPASTAAAATAKPLAPKPPPGPGQRMLSSPRPERRRQASQPAFEILSDDEQVAPLTQENVAKVSAAAAAEADVDEPPENEDDAELGSVSDISAPGIPSAQKGGKTKKTAKKKKRAKSPEGAEGRAKKKKKKDKKS